MGRQLLGGTDPAEAGSKWLWGTEDAARSWQTFVVQNGDEGLMTTVTTAKPLAAYPNSAPAARNSVPCPDSGSRAQRNYREAVCFLHGAFKIMPISYVLKWCHGSEPRFCWFIRGIKSDRSFWGKITVYRGDGGKQINVTGSLSESDYHRFLSLVNEIEKMPTQDDSDEYMQGLLAEGPVSRPSPRILLVPACGAQSDAGWVTILADSGHPSSIPKSLLRIA